MADKRVKQKYRSLSCDPALSVHDNVNHHQNNKRDQHVNTFTPIGSQLVVMVLRGSWLVYDDLTDVISYLPSSPITVGT